MKITGVRAVLLSYVYSEDEVWKWSGGKVDVWNTCLVELRTDEGLTGLGEAGDGHFVPEAAAALVAHFRPMLIGSNPLEVDALAERMTKASTFWGRRGVAVGVISAIETACWDLLGKALNKPVYLLLGGLRRSSIPVYASAGMEKPDEELADELREHVAAGYSALKIRGGYSARRDAALMELARRAVGDSVNIMIDAGQHYVPNPWSLAEAAEVARAIEPYRPFWLEEPLHIEQPREYAELRAKTSVPIAAGENGATLREFRNLLEAGALDVLQPDITHSGGISEVRRIAQLAELHGRKIAPHVFRSGVGLMAHLHLMCAIPNGLIFEHSRMPNPLRDELLLNPVVVRDGRIQAPPANVPGLGVHLPVGLEERYPYQGRVQRFAVEVNR
jgi:L-alanine-DL-glutamate epimerase-like enolase superfamily enzyme